MNVFSDKIKYFASERYNDRSVMLSMLALLLAATPLLAALAPRALVAMPGILAIVFYAAHFYLFSEKPKLNKNIVLFFIGILFLPSISILWAIDTEIAFDRIWKNILTIMPAAILLSVLQDKMGEHIYPKFCKILPFTLLAGLLITAINLNLDGIIYYILQNFEKSPDFNLSHFNRGVVAITLCFFCAIFALKNSGFSDKKTQFFMLGLIIILFDIFYMTHSQSAHLGFGLAIIPFLFFPARIRSLWVALWAILVVLLLIAPWLAQFLFKAYPTSLSELHWFKFSYALQRLEIWDFVSRYALGSPIYGFGIEATKAVEAFDTQKLYVQEATIMHPHNFALQLWIEFGFLGVLACAGFFAILLKAMYRLAQPQARLAIALFLVALSVSATGYGLWQGWWVALLIVMASYVMIFTHIKNARPVL